MSPSIIFTHDARENVLGIVVSVKGEKRLRETNTPHLARLVSASKLAVISTLMVNRLNVRLIAAPNCAAFLGTNVPREASS
jgi:hypothetical protein